MSATLRLADEVDASRGDMICRVANAPCVSQDVEAMVCWFVDKPLTERARLVVQHTTRNARVVVSRLHYRLDVNTLHRHDDADRLGLNDIGRVSLRCAQPLMFDTYRRNRRTGSFILVDEGTNETVGAGMIIGEAE